MLFWRKYIVVCALALGALTLFQSCDERSETPTKGSVDVYVDESLAAVTTAAADSFMKSYTNTKLTVHIVNAREGITKILNGEAKIFVSGRMMNDEETKFARDNNRETKSMKYCFDGVVCVTAPENPLRVISYDSLKLLLSGKLKLKAVVPSINSGITEFLINKGLYRDGEASVVVKKNENDVLAQIEKDPNLIGFVSWNNARLINKCKVLKLGSEVQSGIDNVYYEPHPGFFVQQIYPLTRRNIIILSEIKMGVASGFASYLTANEGQRIILQHQLGPAAVPVRLVQ